ncbi:hypothetical protein [Nonomuraea roseola]|uniref:Ig-like domain-containing protein n=1 Tax=Nonomuraea roseola TaxID=46179 RepID=A0ABV5Q0W7_9ACTN
MRWARMVGALTLGAAVLVAPAGAASASAAPSVQVRNVEADADGCAVRFGARIVVRPQGRTVKVKYRWITGDGDRGPTRTLTFRGHGTKSKTVFDEQEFEDGASGWQAVQILSPRRFTSARARFDVDGCAEEEPEPEASVSLTVDDADSRGRCDGSDHRVTFDGVVRVTGGPATVRYRWRLDGRTVDDGSVRVSRSERLRHVLRPTASGSGTMTLEIWGPNRDADRVRYRVTCASAAPVAGVESVRVEPAGHNGPCPQGENGYYWLTARATIKVSAATTVAYRWNWSTPGHFDAPAETFSGPGEREVSHRFGVTATPGAVTNARMWVEISSPNTARSAEVPYSITCT